MSENLREHSFDLTRNVLESKRGHKGLVLWFYGLSGAGKSTVANAVMSYLASEKGVLCKSLDGDHVRGGLCADLSFSDEDRAENIRRCAHMAKSFADFGVLCIASFITPQKTMRELAKSIIQDDFVACYVKASLEACQERDPKGFYEKARSGKIKNYTGFASSFDFSEEEADLVLDTEQESLEALVEKVASYLEHRGILPNKP